MKATIIGGGNMGGSIARGLSKGTIFKASDITVVDVYQPALNSIKAFNPEIKTALGNYDSVKDADIILLAVKPWLIEDTILDIKSDMDYEKQILVSIAAGVSFSQLAKYLDKPEKERSVPAMYRVIPNTAIAVGESISLISKEGTNPEQDELMMNIFNELGSALMIDENKLEAGTALTSCGIAFFFRFVRAATLAGIEMGIPPQTAQSMVVNTMKGAAELMLHNQISPEDEIDKVTTPGGITIKGINELEANGFSNAIIQALKKCK